MVWQRGGSLDTRQFGSPAETFVKEDGRMHILFMAFGTVLMLIGGGWMIFEAFLSGILWGLAYLFIPFASLIWLITHWEEGSRPFLIYLAGAAVFGLAFLFQ
jgi:hypothetical protein